MSCAAGRIVPTSPATTQSKPPHGYPVNVSPSPRQRSSWNVELDFEDEDDEEEPHSDTAVDAGSSDPLANSILPKDNGDDIGSEYAVSSDEDPVPAKRSRESARLRGVRAPTPHLLPLRSSVSEGRSGGRKRSRSQSVASVSECTLLVTPGSRRRVSKRPTTESSGYTSQRHTHKPRADGGRTGTPSVVIVSSDTVKRLKEHNRRLSTGSPRQRVATGSSQQASGNSRTIPEPAPKSQVTGAGPKPPEDDSAPAAVKQFLTGIGLGQSHLQMLLQEGIRTQQDLDGLQQMEKECMVELRDVLRARGFTAFEFSKVEHAISKRKN